MAPSGLPDDPIVIDDRMDTRESFFDMRKKLVALQKEIQEVIDRQEEEMRRQEEKELNDFCRSHNILIVDKEDKQDEEHVTKNPLKRSRSASSPPPLIPIHDVGLDEDNEDPVLKICFGPPTAESKNLKNHVNFDVGDLFLGPQPFGPPKMSLVLQLPVAWLLILRTRVGSL